MVCSYSKGMERKECIEEYISTLKEENEKKKFKDIENVSDVEIQNFIKNLNSSKK